RMLAAALWRHRSDRSLDDLEQGLLYTLARHVAGDAWVLRLARDLVDLVDVHNATLALGDVEIACLEQSDENVLDIFADVAGLSQSCRVGDGKRNVKDPRESARQQRLADTGGPDEQNVRLVELHI